MTSSSPRASCRRSRRTGRSRRGWSTSTRRGSRPPTCASSTTRTAGARCSRSSRTPPGRKAGIGGQAVMTARSGTVETVLGPVAPGDLGITLPHEHLLCDLGPRFVAPATAEGRSIADEPVSLANLAWVRRNYLSSRDNIVLDDEAVAIEEAGLFKAAGGGTIVDVGSIGIRP